MRTPRAAAAVCLLAAGLIGCQKAPDAGRPVAPDASAPGASQAFPGTQPGSATAPEVPPASTVMAPAEARPAGAASAGRTNAAMSPAQESNAMPLPGQNNDHSAPLPPAKPAKPDQPGQRASAP